MKDDVKCNLWDHFVTKFNHSQLCWNLLLQNITTTKTEQIYKRVIPDVSGPWFKGFGPSSLFSVCLRPSCLTKARKLYKGFNITHITYITYIANIALGYIQINMDSYIEWIIKIFRQWLLSSRRNNILYYICLYNCYKSVGRYQISSWT